MADKTIGSRLIASKAAVYAVDGANETLIGLCRDISVSSSINVIQAKGVGAYLAQELAAVGESWTVNVGHYMVDMKAHAISVYKKGDLINPVASASAHNFKSAQDYANFMTYGKNTITLKIAYHDLVGATTAITQSDVNASKITLCVIGGLKLTGQDFRVTPDQFIEGTANFMGNQPPLFNE